MQHLIVRKCDRNYIDYMTYRNKRYCMKPNPLSIHDSTVRLYTYFNEWDSQVDVIRWSTIIRRMLMFHIRTMG